MTSPLFFLSLSMYSSDMGWFSVDADQLVDVRAIFARLWPFHHWIWHLYWVPNCKVILSLTGLTLHSTLSLLCRRSKAIVSWYQLGCRYCVANTRSKSVCSVHSLMRFSRHTGMNIWHARRSAPLNMPCTQDEKVSDGHSAGHRLICGSPIKFAWEQLITISYRMVHISIHQWWIF
ncbi:hypothetical protein CPB86DRAFT_602917 [Serendipita vermifera]|nr:hypothetical protein CPB86DRAFT_602917 [Serendipita vermifera]